MSDTFEREANRLALQDMKSAQLRFAARVEWKERSKMSDTLQEEEDRLPLVSKNHSEGECSEPDCPCHEWVKRVDRHDNSERTAGRCPHCGARIQSDFDPDVGMWYECSECDYREAVSSTSEHEPAARGGGDTRIRVELINGVEGQCVTVNDYRICGPKPWGGGSIAKSWTTDKNDVLRAFLTPDEKHAWLADDLQVVSVKQHQSLVAERERLRGAIEVAIHNLNAGNDPKFLADYLRLTLNQKGPSA